MRTLNGYHKIAMHEFKGEAFSAVMGEVALFCATVEHQIPEFHIIHEYDAETGEHVVYLYEQYS